jgi:hypothetical protein
MTGETLGMEEGVSVPKPAQTAWADFDEEQAQLFETLVSLLAAEPDWRDRKALFFKIIEKLRGGFEKNRRDVGSNLPFMALLPVHLGAILERLGEERIAEVEQAAFYLLSVHPEHQAAADAWLQETRDRQKAFMKFLGANPFYAALFRAHEQYFLDTGPA